MHLTRPFVLKAAGLVLMIPSAAVGDGSIEICSESFCSLSECMYLFPEKVGVACQVLEGCKSVIVHSLDDGCDCMFSFFSHLRFTFQ